MSRASSREVAFVHANPMRYLAPIVLVSLGTVVSVRINAGATTAVLVLLLSVMGSSLLGRGPALVGSILATLSMSYWFVPPERSFSLGKRDEFIALVAFVVVALVVSTLLSREERSRASAVAESARASQAEAAAAADRSRAVFFATAGHNLRTPLTTIRASADALDLLGAERMSDRERALVSAIAEEATRLERLIAKVLELSRSRTGGVVPDRRSIDLPGLVQAAVARVGLPGEGCRWTIDLADLDSCPMLDPLMVEQILLNLFENSVRYAPAGSTITVSGAAIGDSYRLRVSDEGPGIAVDEREAVFAEFHSHAGRSDGSSVGLGLAIVRSLVEAHGGQVRCVDAPGGGARFEMVFPAVEPGVVSSSTENGVR